MSNTQGKYGRSFDEEFKREVAALASRPGAKQEQVARDLGVSPYRVSRWKKLYSDGTLAAAAAPSGVSVQELERRIKALERENADLREQRAILKKRSPLSRSSRAQAWRDQRAGGRVSDQGALPHPRCEPQRLLRRAEEGATAPRA